MFELNGKADIDETLRAINKASKSRSRDGFIELRCYVDEAEICAVGFTHNDEVPEDVDVDEVACRARDEQRQEMEADAWDMDEAIDLLLAGDRKMGLMLLSRALSEWPDAQRIVELKLTSSSPRDPRQPPLMLAA